MPTFIVKQAFVEARQHLDATPLVVISDDKGQQTAHKGDWLVGSEKGKVYVLSASRFSELFEPYEPSPATDPDADAE